MIPLRNQSCHRLANCLRSVVQVKLDARRCQLASFAPALSWPSSSTDVRFTSEDLSAIEQRWAPITRLSPVDAPAGDDKMYVLCMFPYPSGQLHMGHVRVYTISDCLARFYRMRGKRVLHPIGWDAFGLPAENAARTHKRNPNAWTKSNISSMKTQLEKLGCRFDWDRELSTCDPSYYRWTQWLFCQLHKHGLTSRRWSTVKWDPVDETVLADEQIDADGRSWRSGAPAVDKLMRQWFVRTSVFTEQLYSGLDELLEWRDVAAIQRHWIGAPDFVSLSLPVQGLADRSTMIELRLSQPLQLSRADRVCIRSSHELVALARLNGQECADGQLSAVDPLFDRRLPIVVDDAADYESSWLQSCLAGSSSTTATTTDESESDLLARARSLGLGGHRVAAHSRDWVVSRQRYWGTPIPIVICDACGPQPVPSTSLPVVLPEVDDVPHSSRGSPLNELPEWANCSCPSCGGAARRECDTLDTFFDSSWYFLRYLDPRNVESAFDVAKANALMPVDVYVGGKEHATMHLFYARFMTHFLHSIGLLAHREPFHRLLPQGLVKGRTYVQADGAFVPEDNVVKRDNQHLHAETNEALKVEWHKMSKSKHNGVNPLDMLSELGSDVTRLLLVSNVSPYSDRNWNLDALKGVHSWLNRVRWVVDTYVEQRRAQQQANKPSSVVAAELDAEMKDLYNECVQTVTHHMQSTMLFNSAISVLHKMTSQLRKCDPSVLGGSAQCERCVYALVLMVYPFAPNVASELYAALATAPSLQHARPQSIEECSWPLVDPDQPLKLDVMINGKFNERLLVGENELAAMSAAEAFEYVIQRNTTGPKVKRRKGVQNTHEKLAGRPPLNLKLVDLPDYGRQLFIHVPKPQADAD